MYLKIKNAIIALLLTVMYEGWVIEEITKVIRAFGDKMKNYPTWSVYMLSSMENFEEAYGKKATKKRKLFNGFIRTDYYQFWGQKSKREN